MNKTISIIGLAITRNLVDFEDKNTDHWTLNSGCRLYEKENISLCFDMHNWQTSEYSIDYYDKVLTKKKLNFPIVVPAYDSNILSEQVIYPKNEIIEQYGLGLENSIPEMILYAWYKGYKKIYIYGITKSEFYKQPRMLASLYQAIGFVRAKGVKIWFCNTHNMDSDPVYGYQKMQVRNIYNKNDERVRIKE